MTPKGNLVFAPKETVFNPLLEVRKQIKGKNGIFEMYQLQIPTMQSLLCGWVRQTVCFLGISEMSIMTSGASPPAHVLP